MKQKRTGVKLWKHQRATIRAVIARHQAGVRRLLVVLPTGAGKTVILACLALEAYQAGRRVLIISHRREILNQLLRTLEARGIPADQIGVIRADDERTNREARVQVASVATLVRRELPDADLVMVDEAHRAASEGYRAIADGFPEATHVGFTATPWRLDGKPLGDIYEEIVNEASYSQLIAAGIIVSPKVYSVPRGRIDVSGISVLGGDFNQQQVSKLVNRGVLIGDMVKEWKAHAGGQPTLCFAASVEHARAIAARFRRAGLSAEVIVGETPAAERARITRAFKVGEVQIIVGCEVLGEGIDLPECRCVILARPTKSLVIFNQQAGRGMRKGAPTLVLDHAGNVYRFGFPDMDRKYSLDAPVRVSKMGDAPVKECPVCGLVTHASATVCSDCGHKFPLAEREADEDTRLVEIDREALRREVEERVRRVAKGIPGADEVFIQKIVSLRVHGAM